MLSQQVRSNNFLLENGDLQLSSTSSNLVANYNIHPMYIGGNHLIHCLLTTEHTVASLQSTIFGCFFQSAACIATRFGECSTTLLDRLWYLYSYIYHQASSNSTTVIIPILLFLVVALLMPSTALPAISSIFSPSPFISRTRSFTMTDYTPINDWTLKFSDHPLFSRLSSGLNNTYSKDFNDTIVARLFTNQSRIIVATDAVTNIRAAIVNTILVTSKADRPVVNPIINQMLLFGNFGNPPHRYPVRTPATLTKILNVSLATNKTTVVIMVNLTPIFVDTHVFNLMDFTGILVSPITSTTTPTGAGAGANAAAAAGTTITPTQAATAAPQAHAAQQVAQAAILAATLSATSNLLTLPPDVKVRHLHYLNPSYLLTASDMVPFPTATGSACPSFSHLDPPMGTGVTRQPDSNRVITCNSQFFYWPIKAILV